MTNTHIMSARRLCTHLAFALSCVSFAFIIGMQSSGRVAPIHSLEATSTQLAGDMNENGAVTIEDAILLVSFLDGDTSVSLDVSVADVNGDGAVTLKDVLSILHRI